MPVVKVKDLESLATPLVCRDRDDFTKYFYSLAKVISTPPDDRTKQEHIEFTIDGLQILMHEYLALVMNGKIEPYYIKFGSEKDREETIRVFREGMLCITGQLAQSGVPMQETDDGRMEIMFDDLKELGRKEFGNG